jgi:type II restriction/modification system DNA methylase subunit YeeA
MRKFMLEEMPGKLQNWYLLTYAELIAELGKKKLKLSLADEAEWENYFVQEAYKALAIKNQLETTDRYIDQLVYALYGLTEAEISIVETK